MSKITLGLFDDHPIVSTGVSAFLEKNETDFKVAFCAKTREELLIAIEHEMPDVLVLDVIAPDVNGLELFAEIRERYVASRVIAYTTLKSPVLVENLLSIGVRGFVSKNQPIEDLLQSIKNVYNGYIDVPEKYKHLTSRFRVPVNFALTSREIDILQLIAKEETTQEIATQLGVSVKTIENHKNNLFKKLNVKNSAGLILAATRLGYIS